MNHAIGAELSSSQARDEIWLQRGALRVRLAEVTDVAEHAATSESAIDVLRARARASHTALADHMARCLLQADIDALVCDGQGG
jgi:hypothetical protein